MAATSGRHAIGNAGSFARDAGSGNQIDEAGGIFRHQFQPPLAAGGRGQEHRVETGLAHHVDVRLGLFHAQVRQQAAVDAAGHRGARQRLQAVAQHRVQVGEQQQRNFGSFADLRTRFRARS